EQLLLLFGDQLAPIALHAGDQQHVGAIDIELEILRDVLSQHRRSKGSKALSVLNLEVQRFLHLRVAWIAENGARAKGAGAKLHAALEPADGMAGLKRIAAALEEVRLGDDGKARTCAGKALLDLRLRKLWSQISPVHAVE